MVITQGKFVHRKSLKELFIFEQNVGFLFNALGFLFPPFALLNDKVLQPDDKVLSRVTSIHFVNINFVTDKKLILILVNRQIISSYFQYF